MIRQTLQGISVLHERNIIHRDLKSANIFISGGVYKVADLNVSKLMKKDLAYTQTGTPYYASPEVWSERPYDTKSDIWSLGCVFY
jgi:NIMA (never in mitosis gene a)-related kinase 1/4/5